MQVRHDEGVGIRIDAEPCAAVRKGDSEASVGVRMGQPLSLVKIRILGADAIAKAEGNMDAPAPASGQPGVVEEPGQGAKMRQKSVPGKEPATQVVKNIRRATRRHFWAEDKIRIVLEGLRGEDSIAELCRCEGIVQNLYYRRSKLRLLVAHLGL